MSRLGRLFDAASAKRDHDHHDGTFRGYLCADCNGGHYLDNLANARRLVAYLELTDKHFWQERMLEVQAKIAQRKDVA
jgi:Recombination endonuclease VII